MIMYRIVPPRSALISRLLVAAAATAALTAALAACASSPAPSPTVALRTTDAASADTPQDSASVYGLYLAGEAALDDGASQDAAAYLSRASAKSPDADFIKERAFAAALVAGEVDRAAALAATLRPPAPHDESSIYALGVLARATVYLAENHGKEGYALLSASPTGAHSDAIMLLKPWAAAMAGDRAAAGDPGSRRAGLRRARPCAVAGAGRPPKPG
jgi:hypothetical protein